MKKSVLSLIFAATCGIAGAAGFQSMQFATQSGEPQYMPLEGLEIVFQNGNMLAVAGERSLTISLADLVSMEFSDDEAGVAFTFKDGEPFSVYSASGIYCGKFDSFSVMKDSLADGVYVIKKNDGTSFKINVKR